MGLTENIVPPNPWKTANIQPIVRHTQIRHQHDKNIKGQTGLHKP